MSKVINEAKVKNPLIVGIREQLEHRALWMYLLQDEAAKKGLAAEEYVPAAIKRCGLYQGFFAQKVFEMDILRCDDDHLDIDFHYCPLVKAWQKQGCSDEEIAVLCDYAMCGDRGIGECFGVELDLPGTIAKGDATCQLRYVRREGKATGEDVRSKAAKAAISAGIGAAAAGAAGAAARIVKKSR